MASCEGFMIVENGYSKNENKKITMEVQGYILVNKLLLD